LIFVRHIGYNQKRRKTESVRAEQIKEKYSLMKHFTKAGVTLALSMAFGALIFGAGQVTHRAASATTSPLPSNDKIIRFIRERYGVPDKVPMSVDPFHDSTDPEFLEAYVTSDDGQNAPGSKKSTDICVSKDGRYLVVSYVPVGAMGISAFLPIGTESKEELARRVHDVFRLPESVKLTVGAYKSSTLPDFLQAQLTLDDGKTKSTPDAWVTRDRRFLVLGTIYDLNVDLVKLAQHTLVIENQPSTGPKTAPVTIVEFADYLCPTCARAHDFLVKNLLPTYGDKVRIVFKEFPLPNHEPATSIAAVASQCAYRTNPANFLQFRTLVYQHQAEIEALQGNASRVRDMLLEYGQQAGIDRAQLAGCVDSKATLPRVEANLKEGKAVSVNSTPTFFINGRMQVGAQPEAFYAAVDEALADAKKKSPVAQHEQGPRPSPTTKKD
jgi:protein-disulfide isomerase